MAKLLKQYRDLETSVLHQLRMMVLDSDSESVYVNTKAITVDLYGYVELVLLNDRLTFIDDAGLQYSTDTVPLQELIMFFEL